MDIIIGISKAFHLDKALTANIRIIYLKPYNIRWRNSNNDFLMTEGKCETEILCGYLKSHISSAIFTYFVAIPVVQKMSKRIITSLISVA